MAIYKRLHARFFTASYIGDYLCCCKLQIVLYIVFYLKKKTCWHTCIPFHFCCFVFISDLCCFDFSPPVPPPDHPVYRFAGRTVSSSSLVLVTVATKEEGAAQLTVNCEKMVIGTMLVKDILLALTQWRVLDFVAPAPSHTDTPVTYRPRLITRVASPPFSCKQRGSSQNV